MHRRALSTLLIPSIRFTSILLDILCSENHRQYGPAQYHWYATVESLRRAIAYRPYLASVIAVIGLATSGIEICSRYQKAVKNASGDQARIISELKSLSIILESLKELGKKPASGDHTKELATLRNLGEPLASCEAAITGLLAKLDTGTGKKTLWKLDRRLKWPFQQHEVRDILANLERTKASLQLCLASDHV